MCNVALDRLTAVDGIWLAVEAEDWDRAQRLGREYSDLLRLLADGLGWGRGSLGPVELSSPADVVRGAVEAIRREAGVETGEQRDMRLRVAEAQIDRRDTIDACDEILQSLDGS
jgi:hypothetical protein